MNLFLTVGTQLPFDRLTRAVDLWADGQQGRTHRIFGQIGPQSPGNHRPTRFEWTEFLDPDAFAKRFDAATHIIAHAGMGTIISAPRRRKARRIARTPFGSAGAAQRPPDRHAAEVSEQAGDLGGGS
ncbi:MAG: hypothetical protein AAF479_09695 [Pseudomonadota bacterium]